MLPRTRLVVPVTERDHHCCPKTFICFTTEEGAEEHVQAGAMILLHQRLFDWLDETWARNN